MNTTKILLLLAFITIGSYVFAQQLTGTWTSYDDKTKQAKSEIQIYEKNGKYYGKIIKLLNRPAGESTLLCTECSGELKNKPIEGLVIISNMEKSGDEYKNGKILDPASGKTYTCKINFAKGDTNMLEVRGYLAMFYRTQYWKRK